MPTNSGRVTVFTGPVNPAPLTREPFVHVILFKMYEIADESIRDEALRLMVAMCEEARGVCKYVLSESEDTRKGAILSEYMIFESYEAFDLFKQTSAHQKYAAFIRNYADWFIADNHVPGEALKY